VTLTARDDLDELQALAESISEHASTWRERRQQRHHAAATARLEARLAAPVRRRVRHRRLTAAAVAVVLLVTAGVLFAMRPSGAPPPPRRHAPLAANTPDDVVVGRAAARELLSRGLAPSVFSCQSLYDTDGLGTVPGQQGGTWRAGYLAACSGAVGAASDSG
jgi:hypothetical protein